MNKKEFIKEVGKDLTELKITSALNAALWKGMTRDEKEKFLTGHIKEVAQKFIDSDWTDIVNVRCEYAVVDSYLQTQGTVKAYANYSHKAGVTDCVFEYVKN